MYSELAEYIEDLLELMEDEQHIRYKLNTMLEYDATKQEAAAWVVAFEKYFMEK